MQPPTEGYGCALNGENGKLVPVFWKHSCRHWTCRRCLQAWHYRLLGAQGDDPMQAVDHDYCAIQGWKGPE